MTEVSTGDSAVEQDRAEIKRVHDEWWEANREFDVTRMRACFAGDKILQYNLNGHTYWSLDELTQLWETFQGKFGIPEYETIDLRIEVRGDAAWLTHETVIRVVVAEGVDLPKGIPAEPFRVRETEVFFRDDGTGKPEWKIWHHHSSPHAPDDEVRWGFTDTVLSRTAARA